MLAIRSRCMAPDLLYNKDNHIRFTYKTIVVMKSYPLSYVVSFYPFI